MRQRAGGTRRALRTWGSLALTALVAMTACGGSSKAEDASPADEVSADERAENTTPTSAESKGKRKAGTGSSKAQAKAASGSSTTTTAAGPGATKSTTPEEDPYTRKLVMQVELAHQCVQPGGSQTITVRTMPAAGVGYDTVYSDGLSGLMEGHYGGNMVGFTDPDGTWTHTWTIQPNAPSGPVRVNVLGSHEEGGMGEEYRSFTVSGILADC